MAEPISSDDGQRAEAFMAARRQGVSERHANMFADMVKAGVYRCGPFSTGELDRMALATRDLVNSDNFAAAHSTHDLLAERAKTHGDFTEHARITQLIKATMQSGQNYNKLARTQIEALDMIAHKIGRIIAGDPNHKDHWDDIAGYATLVSERI